MVQNANFSLNASLILIGWIRLNRKFAHVTIVQWHRQFLDHLFFHTYGCGYLSGFDLPMIGLWGLLLFILGMMSYSDSCWRKRPLAQFWLRLCVRWIRLCVCLWLLRALDTTFSHVVRFLRTLDTAFEHIVRLLRTYTYLVFTLLVLIDQYFTGGVILLCTMLFGSYINMGYEG